MNEKATTDPPVTDPAASDPATADPAMTDPATADPAMTDPATADPPATDPAAADTAMNDKAKTDPAVADPAASAALRASHPQFCRALDDFRAFVAAARADIDLKRADLKSLRTRIPAKHGAVKSYLNCQLFMMSGHRHRLDAFEEGVRARLAALDNVTSKSLAPAAPAALAQLLGDMDKMKRRCKHMLDVTDRFCVLSQEDLELKNVHFQMRVDLGDDVDLAAADLDASPKGSKGTPSPMPSRPKASLPGRENSIASSQSSLASRGSKPSSPVPPSQVTENMLRSTFESLGCHLAVIAKTYTSRRASNSSSQSLLSSPTA